MKNLFKKLVSVIVLSLFILPTHAAHALVMLGSPTDELIDNMADATSVDMNIDVDITTDNDQLAQPIAVHGGLDVVSDLENTGSFDLNFWATDQNGAFNEGTMSVRITPKTVYVSPDGDTWYFIDRDDASVDVPTTDDVEESTEDMKNLLKDLFDHEVITYDAETTDVINNKLTVRYAYQIDNDRLVEYLLDEDMINEDQTDDITANLEHLSVSGNLWIDTSVMLPVMFTINIVSTPSASSSTTVNISVLFNSFNAPVVVDEPEDAIKFEDYMNDDSHEFTVASVESTFGDMDTDGDGLTNDEENSTWNTNPLSTDTDNDGYLDRTEVVNGYNPSGSGKLDSDGDGLTDYAEMTIHWSNRFDTDSDNDGYNDGLEIANGYNPNGLGRW